MFIKYKKIHRLGSDENEGILNGTCYIQEKIDGANTQIWAQDNKIMCGSRNNVLTAGFNGFVDYVNDHTGINALLVDHPDYHLYGEWCVRHSISYDETAYRHFYLFDVFTPEGPLDIDAVNELAEQYCIRYPKLFSKVLDPTEEHIMEFVGQSALGEVGEGVVIKNFDFINDFGELEYAKIVTENFKETNALVFGGNNRHSDSYWEMYLVNKYFTLPRIEKIMNKIQPTIDEPLGKQHTSRIVGTVLHDVITEEAWEIAKKVPVLDFGKLKRLSAKKTIKIYHDKLDNKLSIAYGESDNDERASGERKELVGEGVSERAS